MNPSDQDSKRADDPYDTKKYWPAIFNANILAGAMEVGSPLYLTGLFGGFGGYLSPVCHRTLDEAKEWLRENKIDAVIYKLELPREVGFIDEHGKEYPV